MTNETNYRTKANAVFFAAIMVVSMVAVGFAAAPAAAATTELTVDGPVQSGNDASGTVENDTNSTGDIYIVLDEDGDGTYDDGEANISQAAASGSQTWSGLSTDGLDEGDYTVYAYQNASLNDGDDLETNAGQSTTLTIDDTSSELRKATHYVSNSSSIGATIELAFDDTVDASTIDAADITVGFADGTESDLGGSASAGSADGQIFVNTSSTVYNNVENVSISGIEDSAGNAVVEDTYDVTFGPTTVDTREDGSSYEAFRGENVVLEGNAGDSFDVEGEGVSRTRGTGAGSQVYVLNTENFVGDEYNITNNNNNAETTLDVSELGLDVEVDEEEFETDEDVTATVTSDAIDRDITAELIDSDGDEYDTVEGTIDADGELEVDFGTVSDADTYTIEVTDDNSGITAESGDFEVVEARDGDASFANGTTEVTQGDVAEITVELDNTQNGYVVIGNAEDDNYQANISITDGVDDADDADGEVTILFNTYAAGDNTYTVVEAESDDDEAVLDNENHPIQTDVDNLLDTGEYEMIAAANQDSASDAFDNEDAVAGLLIQERSAPEMALWRTTGDAQEDLADALGDDDVDAVEAVNAAVEDGAVTETDTIAIDTSSSPSDSDILVHQVTAPGLEGALSVVGGDDATEQLENLLDNQQGQNSAYSADLVFEEQNPGRNAEPDIVNATDLTGTDDFSEVFTVVYDEETSNYYILVDQDALNSAAPDSFEDGDEFSAEFTIQDEQLLRGSGDSFDDGEELEDAYETANATFSVEEAEADFDVNADDEIETTAEENATVSGTTNVAPSTEFSVRLRSTDDTSPRFTLTDDEVTVNADGTFEASFDLSGQAVNDTFEATFRQAAFDGQDAVDGVIVEAVDEPVDDDSTDDDSTDDDSTDDDSTDDDSTDDDSTDDDSTDDSSADDDSSGDDSTTEDDTPGFGAIVALVALIAAALLATRRNE